ncbi:2407_t:CDS:1, partial [Paraglomus occultum]
MTYNVNNETYEWHSAQEDIVQKIKELMESEKSEDIDSLTFTADKT